MPKKVYKILFASSEVVPFSKTGGLADVASALPKQLKQMGHDIRIVTPKYRAINDVKYRLREVIRLKEISVKLGDKTHHIAIKSAFIPDTKVQVYFIEYPKYYDRESLYVDPDTGTDYDDNDLRFFLFSKGILEIAKILSWKPDIIHCNDWQSGVVPLYLKTLFKDDPFFAATKTVLSIHNVGYQGNFPPEAVVNGGLPPKIFYPSAPVEFHGKFSFLKSGIKYADIVTTVSEKYAEEIQTTDEYGFGLASDLHDRTDDLYGILNGIDVDIWHPEKDDLIHQKFSKDDLEGKEANKKALLERCGLEYNPDVPLIGIISRLAAQKGFDLLEEILDDIAPLNMQMIVLGHGDKVYHDLFEAAMQKYPNKFSVHLNFNNQLAHQIEASSDFFLMPSRYEPCGLNQMYSFMYGTVPIVRSTGGLADTVKDVDENPQNGTGFTFEKYKSDKLLDVIQRAVNFYGGRKAFRALQARGMSQDFSWKRSALCYLDIYAKALEK
ncbi:glycogen synthase GlgA [bacterium]|nr:glycogen synthase GlgA [bacterium]MBU1880598.1 glycogen synthase GlgA [bacterium]